MYLFYLIFSLFKIIKGKIYIIYRLYFIINKYNYRLKNARQNSESNW